MAVTVATTEGFVVKLLQVSEQSSLTAIAEEHSIPYQTLMALQQNNKAVHHTLILERFCSTTDNSHTRPCREEQPDRQLTTLAFKDARPACRVILRYSPPCPRQWQAQRHCASASRYLRPAEVLSLACTAADQPTYSPDDDFALKLYWGRQRGLAVIFATDTIECAGRQSERHFLGEGVLERTATALTPEQDIQEDVSCIITPTPLSKVLSDSEAPQAQADFEAEAGCGLFCRKLAIPEDACSVDGPPTPDNEEADWVCMPAAKRQRLDESPPPAAAVAVARTLHPY